MKPFIQNYFYSCFRQTAKEVFSLTIFMPDCALAGTAKINVILIWVSWHQTISDQQVRALIFGVLDRQQLDK